MADHILGDSPLVVLGTPSLTTTPKFDPSVVKNHIFPWIPPKLKTETRSHNSGRSGIPPRKRKTSKQVEDRQWKEKLSRARKDPQLTAPPIPSLLSDQAPPPAEARLSWFYPQHYLYATGRIITRPRYPAHLLQLHPSKLGEMAARLLTQSNSKLSSQNMIAILSDDESWSTLSDEDQRKLYEMLPIPAGEATVDHQVHPFKGPYADHVKHFLREWQEDLKNGRRTKTWATAAQQASGERADGAFDDWKEGEKEAFWGQKGQSEKEET